ncbi:hypothetical protein D3C72_1851180 [compost metagenome]
MGGVQVDLYCDCDLVCDAWTWDQSQPEVDRGLDGVDRVWDHVFFCGVDLQCVG